MDGLRENVVPHWLPQVHLTVVSMESTGVYWKPIFNILEERFAILLVKARQLKNVPGARAISRTARGSRNCCTMGC